MKIRNVFILFQVNNNPGKSCVFKVNVCVWDECFGGCLDVFRGDGSLTLVVFGTGDQTVLMSSVFVSARLLFCVRIACDVVLESFAFDSRSWSALLHSGWFEVNSDVWWSVCLSAGRAGEAAAAGQSHPRSLRQCQDRQERQLFSIRKTSVLHISTETDT